MIKITSIIFIFVNAVICNKFLGPADVTLERFEKCGDDKMEVKVELSMEKVNRSHSGINVLMESPFDWGEFVSINATFAKWGDGGWKPNAADVSEPDICEGAKKYFTDYQKIFASVGHPNECPIKAGKYLVENYIFNKELSYPVMYGYFRTDFLLVKDNVVFSCIRAYIKTDPKKINHG